MKDIQKGATKNQIIQTNILEGRKVALISSEKITSLVRIRYNNNDTDGTQKWRVIIDDQEFQTSEIKISIPTRTLTETFEGIGEKHHIVCDATGVIFENNKATIY
jgi:hypothetical protein